MTFYYFIFKPWNDNENSDIIFMSCNYSEWEYIFLFIRKLSFPWCCMKSKKLLLESYRTKNISFRHSIKHTRWHFKHKKICRVKLFFFIIIILFYNNFSCFLNPLTDLLKLCGQKNNVQKINKHINKYRKKSFIQASCVLTPESLCGLS